MSKNFITRFDLVEQVPFKKQPPNLPQINYDQALYSLHIQYELNGQCVRFLGYLSPATKHELGRDLDPEINLVLRRLIVTGLDGKSTDTAIEDAPLMNAWTGDKLISIGQACQELDIRIADMMIYLRSSQYPVPDATDYEDIPQMKDLAELHQKIIPSMIEHGLGLASLRYEDGHVALMDMSPLGLAAGDLKAFCNEMVELLGDRKISIKATIASGSTFELREGVQHYTQTFATFAM